MFLRTGTRLTRQAAFSTQVGAAAPERGQSLLASIFSSSSMPAVPLDQAFPGAPAVKASSPAATNVEITTLESGMRVASSNGLAPTVSVGVYMEAGSRYDNPNHSGLSNFFEAVALKSTTNKSEFRMVRDMFGNGSSCSVLSGREHLIFNAESIVGGADKMAPTQFMLETFADCIQNPAFLPEELAQVKEEYIDGLTHFSADPQTQIDEMIHSAAYSTQTLGLPLRGQANTIQGFTPELLAEFGKQFFVPSRMVLSAVGVEHAKFVAMVKQAFAGLSGTVAPPTSPAQYTGGDVRVDRRDNDMTHLAIAFETASWHHKDLIPMCVLQMMMGGGGSFSAGGPGKGMHSRLYTEVLNRFGWVENANSFNSINSDSSLFGLQGSAAALSGEHLAAVLVDQAKKMAAPPSADELTRAKNSLKSAVFMQLEARQMQLEDIGRQVLTYGEYHSPGSIGKQIDAVSASDIQRVATDMLKTPVSVAAVGNLSHVPSIDKIRFGLANN